MSFTDRPDLASRLLGGGVVACNDEFFAPADRLVEPSAPVFEPRTFGAKGQVYDGWETRRRRDQSDSGTAGEPAAGVNPGGQDWAMGGQDWAIVRLGAPGIVHGVVIDTSWFTGNYPPFASVEGCAVDGYPSAAELLAANWAPVLTRSGLVGDALNRFAVAPGERLTHVRLSIYPDGGVARLRVHGEVVPDLRLLVGARVDLAATEHGGQVIDCSDMFYGTPSNLLLPGLAGSMGEGWETARRRDSGNDWVSVRLGLAGAVHLVELDTSHFKGNAPAAAKITGVDESGQSFVILPRTRLQPDTRHRFPVVEPSARTAVATHVRLDIFPDGGMARLRVLGEPRLR